MTQKSNLSFDNLGIAPKILEVLDRMKFKVPTPIQHKAIPVAIEGEDIIGIAQTGTGKTLAFATPIIQRLARTKGRCVVLAPTRELAIQVNDIFRKIASLFGIRTVVIIGGAPIRPQIAALKKNPRVIIATPGRLFDHMTQRTPLCAVCALSLALSGALELVMPSNSTGSLMKNGNDVWLCYVHLIPEQLRKQVMVTVPDTIIIQGN